jgi:hypothetical protein
MAAEEYERIKQFVRVGDLSTWVRTTLATAIEKKLA